MEARTSGRALSSVTPAAHPEQRIQELAVAVGPLALPAVPKGYDDAGEAGNRDTDLNVSDQQTFRGHPTSRSSPQAYSSCHRLVLLATLLLTLVLTRKYTERFCGY